MTNSLCKINVSHALKPNDLQCFPLFFIVLMFLVVVNASPVMAQAPKIKDVFDKNVPTFDPIDREEFDAMSTEIHATPGGDPDLSFKVSIPKDWDSSQNLQQNNISLSHHLLTEIISYKSKPRLEIPRSFFTIRALELEQDITADQWFFRHVLSNAYNLEGISVVHDRRLEALYVEVDMENTFVVYTLVMVNGAKLIVVDYKIPAEKWGEMRGFVQKSLRGFTLLNQDDRIIGDMLDYQFLDISTVSYPQDWELKAIPIRSIDRMQIQVNSILKSDQKETIKGQVDVMLVSNYSMESLRSEISNIQAELRKKGFLIGDEIDEYEDARYHEDVEFGFVKIYEATNAKTNLLKYEIWTAVLALENYFYFLTLTTPHRDTDYFVWSQNTGAFQAMLQRVRLQDKENFVIKN